MHFWFGAAFESILSNTMRGGEWYAHCKFGDALNANLIPQLAFSDLPYRILK